MVSEVGPICVFPFISGGPQGSVVVEGGDHSFASDYVYYGFIFTHVILHFFLDVGVVLQQIVEMFLTVGQIFFETSVLVVELLIYSLDFVTFLAYFIEFSSSLVYPFLYFFWVIA